jgi:hypothetical protein
LRGPADRPARDASNPAAPARADLPRLMDENQSPIPESFIALFVPRGRMRPSEPRATIAARYDLCEDMAQMLTEHARTTLFALSITEGHVLERMHDGLRGEGSVVSRAEAGWVITRLAELLDWPRPELAPDAANSAPDS